MPRFPLFVILALAVAGGCKKEETKAARTEPWPAPALSTSGAVPPGQTLAYELAKADVEVDVRGRRARASGKLSGAEGSLELDPSVLQKSRGSVRFDLSTLELDASDPAPEADAAFMLAALRALELTADRPAEQRERSRWAEVRINGFDPPPQTDTAPRGKKTLVRAYVDVTVHGFRVPMTLELEVELEPSAAAAPGELRVRTRRPVSLTLAAHDILPRDASGAVTLTPPAGFGGQVPKEARVSVDLTFRPERSGGPQSQKVSEP